jgi:uncharacterized membrane protein YjjP (DUF1212 family)
MSARPELGAVVRSDPLGGPGNRDAEHLLVEAIGVLHASGAESDRTERRTRRLARALGLNAHAELGWSWSDVTVESEAGSARIRRSTRRPDGLAMNRVMAVDRIIVDLERGTLALSGAWDRLRSVSALPAANTVLFTVACAVGGCGLGVLFGVRHGATFALIAAACALGALVRRGLGRLGASGYAQVSAAGVIAGLGGAASSAIGVSSSLGLAALCPCMILVPGPHLLKGSLDVATSRIPLGVARLVFSTVTLISITAGLLVGLWIGGAHLVGDPPGRHISILLDVPTAGILTMAYGVFFSAPLRILFWPFLAGSAAHALRWWVVERWDWDPWAGAGLACLFVGLVLIPICERRQLPFAVLGFASVASLLPGVLIFRALAGLVELPSTRGAASQERLVETVDNASSAALTVFAMALGFVIASEAWSRLLVDRVPAARTTHRDADLPA